jgi:hypothetical protein
LSPESADLECIAEPTSQTAAGELLDCWGAKAGCQEGMLRGGFHGVRYLRSVMETGVECGLGGERGGYVVLWSGNEVLAGCSFAVTVGYGVVANIADSHSAARGSIPRSRVSFCSFALLRKRSFGWP